jgi:enterochelin esterase-like enzyme
MAEMKNSNMRLDFSKLWWTQIILLIFCLTLFGTLISTPSQAMGNTDQITSTTTPTSICQSTHGKITPTRFDSTVLEKPFIFRVYTPPCFNTNGTTRYPVLYILHGQSSNDDQWDRLGMDEAADKMINSGSIAPLIIVMPQETNYLEDTKFSKYGEALVDELLPWIDMNFPTIPGRQTRAIGGLSRGAGWAMRMGLMHPELFGSIGGHSLAQFKGDYFIVPQWRKRTSDVILPRIYLDIGLLDFVKDTARVFETRLSEYSYPHEWHLNTGSHTETYWSNHVDEYLIWYNQAWDPSSIVP